MTKTVTTVTTEIQIPLREIESPLLPTGWHFPCLTPPPPLQLHAMVSSTQKPKALDNQDEEDEGEARAEDENENINSIDYPVLISDTEYVEFCSQMNTLIQQYDVIDHQRKRISYYRHASFFIILAMTTNIYFAKLNEESDVNFFLHLLLATGYFFGLAIINLVIGSLISACVAHSPMQRIKRELEQLYDSVNQLCSERSFQRMVLVPPSASLTLAVSSIPTPVTVTLKMNWKFESDLVGKYRVMDSVQIVIDKTITTTQDTASASIASITTTVPTKVTKSTVSLEGVKTTTTTKDASLFTDDHPNQDDHRTHSLEQSYRLLHHRVPNDDNDRPDLEMV